MIKFKNLIAIVGLVATVAVTAAQSAGPRGQGQDGGRRVRGEQGRRGGFGGGQMQFRQGSELQLAFRKDVQADLGLSSDQIAKLEAIQAQRREAMGDRGQGQGQGQPGMRRQRDPNAPQPSQADREARRAEMQKRQEEAQKQLEAIFTDAQKARLKEISLQQRGAFAIVDPKIQDQLSLTVAQKDQLTTLMTNFRTANQAVMQKVRSNELTQDQVRELMTKNSAALKVEVAKILTAEQNDKLKAMQGRPFAGNLQQGGRRGGGDGAGKKADGNKPARKSGIGK